MTEINFEELSPKLEDFVLVDVRQPNELMMSGKLPGAFNLPHDELEDALSLTKSEFLTKYGFSSLRDNENKIVVYCHSGRRVNLAQDILFKNGFTKHRLYKGSFQNWVTREGPIETLQVAGG